MGYDYDIIVIGGGVGGSALAGGMAAAGAKVLVLEAEESFHDRVRGEAVMPWGVAEARLMGLDAVLEQTGANSLPFWDSYQGPDRSGHRDLTRTTKVKEPVMACYHPVLQETLLQHAEQSGAGIWRGTRVSSLAPRSESKGPLVSVERNGKSIQLSAPNRGGSGRTRLTHPPLGRISGAPRPGA